METQRRKVTLVELERMEMDEDSEEDEGEISDQHIQTLVNASPSPKGPWDATNPACWRHGTVKKLGDPNNKVQKSGLKLSEQAEEDEWEEEDEIPLSQLPK